MTHVPHTPTQDTDLTVPWVHRVVSRAMLMLAIALLLTLLRAVRSIALGRDMGWFVFGDHKVGCAQMTPGCGALTNLIYGFAAWTPPVIVALVAGAFLLGSGRWRDGRWASEVVAAIAVAVATVPPAALLAAPGWAVAHVKWTVPLVGLALLLVTIDALLRSDAPGSAGWEPTRASRPCWSRSGRSASTSPSPWSTHSCSSWSSRPAARHSTPCGRGT